MAEKGKRGGKRPGAGRPKGSYNDEQSEIARRKLKSLVRAKTTELVEAQIASALGVKYLVVREKSTGKFVKVARDEAEKLDPGKEIIEVWSERPSQPSFSDLMNRTIGRPPEHIEMDQTVSGGLVVKWEGE